MSEQAEPNGAVSADTVFDCHGIDITVLLGGFIVRRLLRLYELFDGDMVLPIILGEIAHHNISHHFASSQLRLKGESVDWHASETRTALVPCNALSISDATGIPRETCRRKVKELCDRGLIEPHADGGYIISEKISERFGAYNREAFTDWLALSKVLSNFLS